MPNEITWKTERRKISELKPAEYNPRKATEKECQDLSESLEKFSVADPIVINRNNNVIGGHFRIKILKDKGIKEVDVRVPNKLLTTEEEQELNLRLNKNLGSWDYEMLANFNKELLEVVGFSNEEILLISGNIAVPNAGSEFGGYEEEGTQQALIIVFPDKLEFEKVKNILKLGKNQRAIPYNKFVEKFKDIIKE